jgi:hypothetical protein
LPGRIRLAPVRGYDGQAARVAGLLPMRVLAPDGTPEFGLHAGSQGLVFAVDGGPVG